MAFCIKQELEKVNNRLRAGAVRVQIYRKGNKLYLQGTFPPKPGAARTTPHQQYLTLGVSANAAGLKVAEAKAKEIGALLDLGRFDWTPYLKIRRDVEERELTVAEWIEQFEQHYFESRPRTSAKLNTFQKNYLDYESFSPACCFSKRTGHRKPNSWFVNWLVEISISSYLDLFPNCIPSSLNANDSIFSTQFS